MSRDDGSGEHMAGEIDRDLIRRRLKELGLSAERAAVKAGLGKSTIKDILRREGSHPRSDTISAIERALQMPSGSLLRQNVTDPLRGVSPATLPFAMTPVVGHVQAGVWRSSDVFDTQADPPTIGLPDVGQYQARQVAYQVHGDSMNLTKYQDGVYAVCVDWVAAGFEPESGMTVIVERTQDGGQTFEYTIKVMRVFRDRVEFHPQSSNPIHQPIVVPLADLDDGTTVRILAKVVGAWSPE